MKSLLLQYCYLQLLDMLTTVAFLRNGIKEANPILSTLIQYASSPVQILIGAKLVAIALAYVCWRLQKKQLLARVTILYAALVCWNIVALLVGPESARPA